MSARRSAVAPSPAPPPAPTAAGESPLPIPDLPPYVEADAVTLREACNRAMVGERKGKRLRPQVLQRWCTVGYRVVTGGPLYRFPSVRGPRDRLTTPAWCAAWNGFVARVRAEEVRRQLGQMGAVRAAAERGRPAKGDRLAAEWGV